METAFYQCLNLRSAEQIAVYFLLLGLLWVSNREAITKEICLGSNKTQKRFPLKFPVTGTQACNGSSPNVEESAYSTREQLKFHLNLMKFLFALKLRLSKELSI